MQTGFLLRDDPPSTATGLRPITWHVAALLAAGFRVAVHETKHDASSRCWRTWRATERTLSASPDPDLAAGSAHCVAMVDNGTLRSLRPFSPYLAAYTAAKNLDTILAWQQMGGVEWYSKPIAGGVSPLAEVVSSVGNPDLSEMALGVAVTAKIPHPILAAALVTLGFPLAGLTPAGVVQVKGVVAAHRSSSDQAAAESLLCPGLSFGVAHKAALALESAMAEGQRRNAVAESAGVEQAGDLPGGHLFNWAYLGASRRHGMRSLEGQMGYDNSRLRSHVLQPKKGKRVDDGLSVICTAAEYSQNEAQILRHLRAG